MYCTAITTAPPDEAPRLAACIVEARLAACVQVIPGVSSYFWWQGGAQNESESVLLCKTTDAAREELTALIQREHSYDVPELVFLPIDGGLESYLSWIGEEVQAEEA